MQKVTKKGYTLSLPATGNAAALFLQYFSMLPYTVELSVKFTNTGIDGMLEITIHKEPYQTLEYLVDFINENL